MIKKFILSAYIMIIIVGCSSSELNYDRNTILPADRLIKKLEINRRKIKLFEGTGVLKINSPKLKATSNFEVIVKKPDSVRISFYGPFGVDIAHVFIQKKEVKLFDVLQNTLYVSSRNNDFIYRLFQVDITFDDLLNALIGSVDMAERLQAEPDEYSFKDKYKLVYVDKVRTEKSYYYIDIEKLATTKYFVEKFNGEKVFEANYSDFIEKNNMYLPNRIYLINPDSSQELFIEYRRMKINGEEKDLRLVIPNDVKIIKLD